MAKKDEVKFEKVLGELEDIVNELESGKLTLDDSLAKFEKGLEHYKKCRKLLNEAEKKITVLSESMKEQEYND